MKYINYEHELFMKSLQNPSTLLEFFSNLETLIHNGEYSYSHSLSLFQNIFPQVKSAKGVRQIIKRKYKNEELAENIYELLISSPKINNSFLQRIDDIIYPFL